jgi:AraC family transcriptional regulator
MIRKMHGVSDYAVRARAAINGGGTGVGGGRPDILHVALDVGYGSHEAFTWAFREQFGVTPEAIRAL